MKRKVIAQFNIDEMLTNIDNTAHGFGKLLKTVAKYFVAILLYLCLNALIAILFNSAKTISLDIVRLLDESTHTMSSQNFVLLVTLFSNCKLCTFTIVAVVTAISLLVGIRGGVCVVRSRVVKSLRRMSFAQRTCTRENVFSYRQHVAFLA